MISAEIIATVNFGTHLFSEVGIVLGNKLGVVDGAAGFP